MPPPVLTFIHIPRTGGSTFREILGQNFDWIYDVDDRDIHESLKGYDDAPVLWGHVGFDAIPGALHIVILRDPVERVASEYRYILQSLDHPFREFVGEMSLTEYAESGIGTAVDNQQVRMMCGTDVSMVPYDFPLIPHGHVNRGMLTRAKRNLRACLCGVFEEYDVFIESLCRRFDWKARYGMTNGTEYAPVTPQERLAILRRNRLDMELYLYASHHNYPGRSGA